MKLFKFSVLNQVSTLFSEGLFNGAIVSGATIDDFNAVRKQSAPNRETAIDFIKVLGCYNESDYRIVECIQHVDNDDILEALSNNDFEFIEALDNSYSADAFFFKDPREAYVTGKFNRIPIIIGFNRESGISNLVAYLNDTSLLHNLNENWETLGSKLIFGCNDCNEEEIEKANKIRQIYFEDLAIDDTTLENLIRMTSDLTNVGVQRFINIVSNYTRIHQYVFAHEGSFSMALNDGLPTTVYGAAKGDDSLYIYNIISELFEFPTMRSESDKMVRDFMVDIWTNFADSQIPTSTIQPSLDWVQFNSSDPKYLFIKDTSDVTYDESRMEKFQFLADLFPMDPVKN